MALSASFELLSRPGKHRWLQAHLQDAMLELRLAHPANRASCQARVDAIVDKMAEMQALL